MQNSACWAMQQQTFSFHTPEYPEPDQNAAATPPLPPVGTCLPKALLVRPDRQLTYGGVPPHEWPLPEHDRDTITVDRPRHDIDGPPHRFVIKRGDIVELLVSPACLEIVEVIDIDHVKHEVQVSCREANQVTWFAKERIYPPPEEASSASAPTTGLLPFPSGYTLSCPITAVAEESSDDQSRRLTQNASENAPDESMAGSRPFDPRTFLEFRKFLHVGSEGELTDEQLARYDALHADVTRERRATWGRTTTADMIADASASEVKYLDGIRQTDQIKTLDMALRVARFARIRQTGGPRDEEEPEPSLSDVRYVNYPYPNIHRRHLENAVANLHTHNRAKLAAERMAQRLACQRDEYLIFREEHDVKRLKEFVERLKKFGHDTEVFEWALEKYDRLHEANITDIHELRAALREYLSNPKLIVGASNKVNRKSWRSRQAGNELRRFE